MTSKIAFFDIDGTLTRPDGTISQSVIDAVKNAAKKNVRIVLASGRPTFGMLSLAEIFDLQHNNGYIISYNGCALYHVPDGKYLSKHALSYDILKLIDNELQNYPYVSPIFYNNEQILTIRGNEFSDFEGELNKAPVYTVADYPMSGSPKLIWAANPNQLDEIEKIITQKFGHLCTIARSLSCFLEFTPLGIDKGSAVKELCELLNHPIVNTVAFGDGNNDKAMLEMVGTAVAMENGRDELKSIADFIAPSNQEDGVIVAIEKFLLNDE